MGERFRDIHRRRLPRQSRPRRLGRVLTGGGGERVLQGAETDTTNNRMELTAAIMALQELPAESSATTCTRIPNTS